MGFVPEALLRWGVARRLKAGPMYKDENKKTDVRDAVGAEVEGDGAKSLVSHLSTGPFPTLPP